MKITYLENGTTEIDTSEYLKESIDNFPENVNKTAATPATRGLFELDIKSQPLDKEGDKIFYRIVAKLCMYRTKDVRTSNGHLPIASLGAPEYCTAPSITGKS